MAKKLDHPTHLGQRPLFLLPLHHDKKHTPTPLRIKTTKTSKPKKISKKQQEQPRQLTSPVRDGVALLWPRDLQRVLTLQDGPQRAAQVGETRAGADAEGPFRAAEL